MIGYVSAALVMYLSLFGFRYDHRAITHDVTPGLSTAIATWDLPDGGPGADVVVRWDAPGGQGAISLPDVDCDAAQPDCLWNRRTAGCVITIGQSWYLTLSPEMQQAVITHEVGHCLGLAHDDGPDNSIMHSKLPASLVPTLRDRSKVIRLYPVGRVGVAGLSKE